ncbi:hypothetical protein [Budvicia aquatica]|uniref:DUF4440 domain-containing protein n=1 Tax=Budvicia aquatica TaxID=82979 RepID=A0A2C6DQ66_9GAMM|nr:hypothetical protein [Budvicia aquatica]PHI30951.1 hypothetical protein CRN84_17205 [Budvicia aquatica]GKX53041.1 hypothetical protein SOASR029_33500 [Budvicia aquatica]VFS50977.1 Uncharacterised protein [Budvicia aquatica]
MIKKIITTLVIALSLSVISMTHTQAINITPSSAYQFEKHGDFQVFWQDLRRAVVQNDRDGVSKMLNYPFSDYEHSPMIFQNQAEFIAQYDELFNAKMIKLIETNHYRQGEAEQEDMTDAASPEGYIIEHENSDDGYNLVIEKVDGIYKLVRIAFYS